MPFRVPKILGKFNGKICSECISLGLHLWRSVRASGTQLSPSFWESWQDRFRTITLVPYIGSLPNLATWFPCGRGRTLFILGWLPLYRLIIYIDVRILWCTHFLFYLYISIHAYKSTSNDTKGFYWKELPSWKCEILHVIFTTMHKNN
jgi:hypothetical protein